MAKVLNTAPDINNKEFFKKEGLVIKETTAQKSKYLLMALISLLVLGNLVYLLTNNSEIIFKYMAALADKLHGRMQL
ncbi:MAG: hypothetical protein A2X93_04240 [Deltaproteobacteria bacterium GWC2_56_8]|nr:MAG: hypothetical protein A2X99_04125 [Deltaproteobacteria bacterium GWB2_55_19]OGP36150.1 MAG: hypothetical protein A2X93_04240 [Deltaproteobacteria bacterium GWC2_56_8]HAO92644.1 hypothetical protein [Deltaproteobacteria bacterium]